VDTESVRRDLERVQSELDDVERALERLDEGRYGTCETCGAEIDGPRLEADPTARLCSDHAASHGHS
jgi:DnaK suppressor protein